MARKKKHEEHENHERWLISYADFITLLFAFFVVMYAVSSINEGKYRVLSDALVSAFRSSERSMTPIQVGQVSKTTKQPGMITGVVDLPKGNEGEAEKTLSPIKQEMVAIGTNLSDVTGAGQQKTDDEGVAAIKRMADKVEQAMSNLIAQDLVVVRRNDLWVEVEINTSILFPSGSADLQNAAMPILSELAKILKDFPNPIRVEGFTDTVPINTLVFPSNWELSAARAASVVHLFAREGVNPRRMAAIGLGEFHPIADNSTLEGRNKNRRVVILILESTNIEKILGNGVSTGGDAQEQQAGDMLDGKRSDLP